LIHTADFVVVRSLSAVCFVRMIRLPEEEARP